eukprot:jgi/Ulvmu1/4860/UM020_0146.1
MASLAHANPPCRQSARICQQRAVLPKYARHGKAELRLACACRAQPVKEAQLEPCHKAVTAFAPATVANLGPGFDWIGCAIKGEGDTVRASVIEGEPGKVVIQSIIGDNGKLTLEAEKNCVGIAAAETLKLLPGGGPSCGVALELEKGLPLGSGMGSSAASAAAACWAVNKLFGEPVKKEKLVLAGLQSEAFVSGYHADNIAPALLGGFILVRSADPLDIQLIKPDEGYCKDLRFVLVTPTFEAPTREMRAALPAEVPFKSMIANSVAGASLVAAILTQDTPLLGRSLDAEVVVEAARGPLIPGFAAVKRAAKAAGAYGCTISGAGPTVVAVVDDEAVGERVGQAMSDAFLEHGKLQTNVIQIVELCEQGAITVKTE